MRGNMRAFSLSQIYLKNRAHKDDFDSLAIGAASRKTPLSDLQHNYARTAWSYFQNFTNSSTGLAVYSDGENRITPWEIGAQMNAIICAMRLGLVDAGEATHLLNRALHTIAGLPRHKALPCARYDIVNAQSMRKSANAPQTFRLVAAFIAVAHYFPEFAPEIALILSRWKLRKYIRSGNLRLLPCGHRVAAPEYGAADCLGFGQYAARAACLVGLKADVAGELRDHLGACRINGILIPIDKRHRDDQLLMSTVPLCLEAFGFGFCKDGRALALAMFLAQKKHFQLTGTLTALAPVPTERTSETINQGLSATGPDGILCRIHGGENRADLRCVSTAAAFCHWAVAGGAYGQKLLDAVDILATQNGWQAGLFNHDARPNSVLSLNTNAVILEAIHFKCFGPLFPTTQAHLAQPSLTD